MSLSHTMHTQFIETLYSIKKRIEAGKRYCLDVQHILDGEEEEQDKQGEKGHVLMATVKLDAAIEEMIKMQEEIDRLFDQ